MIMTCYQSDDDITVWTCDQHIKWVGGEIQFVILIKKILESWHTSLCVVSPGFVGHARTFNALKISNWDMETFATEEDKSVVLVKLGHCVVLWEHTDSDWVNDLEVARTKLAEYNEQPELIWPRLEKIYNGKAGYDILSGVGFLDVSG